MTQPARPKPAPQTTASGAPDTRRSSHVLRRGPTSAELLAKVPKRSMTPEQQLAALDKVQQQAEARVKLGQQLFQAAEARLERHQDLLGQVRKEQDKLREQVQADVASSLQTYDQWMGRIDERFTRAMAELGGRLDRVERELAGSRDEVAQMLTQAAALLGQPPQETEETPTTSAPPAPVINPNAGGPPATPASGNIDVLGQVLDQLRPLRDDDPAAA